MQQLAEMGFPWEACRKAVHFTGNTGSEAAMNWVMEHMGDADFAEPLVFENKKSSKFFSAYPSLCDIQLRLIKTLLKLDYSGSNSRAGLSLQHHQRSNPLLTYELIIVVMPDA